MQLLNGGAAQYALAEAANAYRATADDRGRGAERCQRTEWSDGVRGAVGGRQRVSVGSVASSLPATVAGAAEQFGASGVLRDS